MRINLTTDYVTTDLVTVQLAEQHLKLSAGFNSAVIENKLSAARKDVETRADRSILNQTWTMYLDEFPSNEILLPKGFIQSVTSVRYYANGVLTTLVADTDYRVVSGDKGFIEPINSWPGPDSRKNAVEIIYVAGYGTAPNEATKWAEEAILMRLEMLYEPLSSWTMDDFEAVIYQNKCYYDY